MSSDRYEAWYAAKLWELLPAIYRAEDSDELGVRGPLEELVARIAGQIAVVRRSIDRLWEDQSIETCDDALIEYIGDLLATNQVASLDARGRRLDVAKTIYYRRRKGTVALLEELATDITGWSVRVTELFHNLARSRHLLDPAIGRPTLPVFSPVTHTGASTGTLRPGGAPLLDHAVAVRIDAAGQAGVARWSASIDGGAWSSQGAAAAATLGAPGGGSIEIALVDGGAAPSFAQGDTFGFAVRVDPAIRLQRAQRLIGPRTRTPAGGTADLRDVIGASLAGFSPFDEYAHTADVRRGRGRTGWHAIPRIGVFAWRARSFALDQVTPVHHTTCPGHYTFDPTGRDVPLFAAGDRPTGDQWVSPQPHQLPGPISRDMVRYQLGELYRTADDRRSFGVYRTIGGRPSLIEVGELAADPRQPNGKPYIDPVRGRVVWPAAPSEGPFYVDYHEGFSSEIGARGYDRPPLERPHGAAMPPATRITAVGQLAATGAQALILDSSLTFTDVLPIAAIDDVVIAAGDQRRPLIRLPETTWRFTGNAGTPRDALLALDGLFVSGGGAIELAGAFDTVVVSCCTLDPGTRDATGWRNAADGRELWPTPLVITGTVARLVIDRSITGPITTGSAGRVGTLVIRDSIVQAAEPGASALAVRGGLVELSRVTLLGRAEVHQLEASECIFHDDVTVEDTQHGCVRFTALTDASTVPRRYEHAPIAALATLFESRTFGDPAYAQLLESVPAAIAEGAENGSEMGAFWRDANAIKLRSLLVKYQEYLPLGLEPVVVSATRREVSP